MLRHKERRRLPACIFGSLRSSLIISALPERLPASICVRTGCQKKGCLLPEHRNRISLCRCLLGPHAVCLLPDGKPAPHGQALAPEDVTSSLPNAGRCHIKPGKKIKNEEMQHTPIREAAARLHLPPPTPTARRNASSQHPTRTTYW